MIVFGIIILSVGILLLFYDVILGAILSTIGITLYYFSKDNGNHPASISMGERLTTADNEIRTGFYRQLEESLRVINETTDINVLISQYDKALKLLNDEQSSHVIESKDSIIFKFDGAIERSLKRIFSIEIDEQVDRAMDILTPEKRLFELNKVLEITKISFEQIPEKWTTPELRVLYGKTIIKIKNTLESAKG